MAVTYPSTYTVTPAAAMVLPPSDAAPVSTAMLNAAAGYQQHTPPLVLAVYTVDPLVTRQTSFRVPIAPSDDGLVYRVRSYVRTGTGTTAISWSVEWQTAGGGWTSIASGTTSAGASTVVEISTTATIPAAADELRLRYSRGTDPYTPDSVTVYPDSSNAPSARTASGFWPYDDGLLTAAGAPINTELLHRPLRNARAIVTDRQQCLLSWVQEDDTANARYSVAGGSAVDGSWVLLAHGVASVPYAAGNITATVEAIASVGGGATGDLIRISAGGEEVTLDADAAVNAAALQCVVQSPGTLGASIRWTVWANNTSGNETYPHAITAHYSPTHAPNDLLVKTPDAPASTHILAACVRGVESLLLSPWAQPALCYDGGTDTDLLSRRFVAAIPPACQFARAAIVRCDLGQGTLQSDSTIAATTTSGVPASPGSAIVTVDAPTMGTESYFDVTAAGGSPVVVWSSGDNLVSTPPGSTQDRGLELVEALAAGYEVIEVTRSYGFALHLCRVRSPADWQDI